MPFRNSVSVALLSSGLFLAACKSEDPSPPRPEEANPVTGEPGKGNGTLKVDGKPFPAQVTGRYGDTSVTLGILANLDDHDTGWTVTVVSKPSRGPQPLLSQGEVAVAYLPGGEHPGCAYAVKAGNLTFDAWDEYMVNRIEMAKISGSGSFRLERRMQQVEGCPEASLEVSFRDVEISNLDAAERALR